ncbi:PREDICTED: uncharacterized protein LOC104595822 [Nelumbo nucifera]|uniref:Uncharacterized protein LOC104595822 n=1 Tax=Nelumbo nucifera TaxID=4432 RepID=A0A1U7ZSJ5_NELNU|nr:PREDICTED: uncharacterized protein LOC104595822 [Nelumbo nucifera]
MDLQSIWCSCWYPVPSTKLSYPRKLVTAPSLVCPKISGTYIKWEFQNDRFMKPSKSYTTFGFKKRTVEFQLPNLSREVAANASSYVPNSRRNSPVVANKFDRAEPFRGKSGSVSFYGITHQVIEEGKLVSSPFKDGTGSFIWVLAPVALISSLVLPQFFLSNAIDAIVKDETLAEIVASFSSEVMFYLGLAAFFLVTNHVQKPYLQFSAKRWGLITGLRGYLTSAFFTMGFKVFAPLLAVYVTWPALGLPALVAVTPFLLGCAAQFVFEVHLDRIGSSCWPVVPIIFEIYRLYQLSKAAHFIEKMMFSMKGYPVSPQLLERSNASVSMLVSFQVLGVVCLWSLTTFLLRLFPSRPVAENY